MSANIEKEVLFYETEYRRPVAEFLQTLSIEDREQIYACIQMLQQHGVGIGLPTIRKVSKALYELRVRTRTNQIRFLFAKYQSSYIILHGFVKKSAKTPKRDIKTALNRLTAAYRI